MVGKKLGRPTESPKRNDTRIRMTDEELAILNYCCEQTGLTKTDVINLGIKKVYESIKK